MALDFREYEENHEGVVTGYKVMRKGVQVGTLEYRSHAWIGAIMKDIKVMTKRDKSVMRLANWMINEFDY